ncbi:MAG: co-chaperone GroES [Rhodospirillaceae bacterium]|jgi:chaperonin GroES|nr:co-chaperone GroES [Rhodospirillaceae bacterium]MBT6136538.1 co-chaperone GroES [Rhodospirillaceae bacterium]
MSFRPLHDRVVVSPLDSETKTAGGIIIPDTAQEKPSQGKVLSVGPGSRGDDGKLAPLDVKKGDTVLYGKWSGTEVKVDGQDVLIMRESDIMGIVG